MAHAAVSGTKLSLSAVTSPHTKEVEVIWTIDNFKMLVDCAKALQPVKKEGESEVPSTFTLTEYFFNVEHVKDELPDSIRAKLQLSENFSVVGLFFNLTYSLSPVWMATFSASLLKDNQTFNACDRDIPHNFKKSSIGWPSFFRMENLQDYVNSKGTLTIKMKLFHLVCSSLLPPIRSMKPSFPANKKIISDFRVIFQEGKFTDVEIKVNLGQEKSFKCHKAILSARSPVFRAMFENENLESRTGVVAIPDTTPAAMEQFLCYVYSGNFTSDLSSSWTPLLPQIVEIADKYCVMDLLEFCDKNIISSVTTENAVDLITLMKRLRLEQATNDVETFITKNIKDVFHS